jgi:hypothetical protein
MGMGDREGRGQFLSMLAMVEIGHHPEQTRLQGSKHVQHEAVVVVSLWDVKLANIHMKRVDGVGEA